MKILPAWSLLLLIALIPAVSKKEFKADAFIWQIQPGSKIDFTITNFGVLVSGALSGLKGTIIFDPAAPEKGKFDVSIPVNTINTGINQRDKDLMDEKYFDTAKYPNISYKSEKITKNAKGFVFSGILTIKGKSLKKAIIFTFKQENNTAIFSSSFIIKRRDYNIGGTGKIMGRDINVSLLVPVKKTN